MKKAKIDSEGAKLREKAEELLKRNSQENANPIAESEASKLVHELQVHQIELELQNEVLNEAKEAAQIATEKYVELYDFALFGFFTLSKEGEILALNFNGAKMLGKNRSELVNRRFALFISDESKAIFNSFCDTIISSKAKQSCEVELLNNSSSPTYLHLSGVIKENDDQFFVMALDITSRKLAEIEQIKLKAKVEESEQKYRTLYENAPLPYQSLNEDGSFKDVNPAWLSTLGYKREEVIGKFYKDFLHPDWQSHFEKNFPAFKKRGYVSNVEFKIRHKKGHYIDISFEGCIGYHPDGSFKQTYCVFQDITYKKQAENALVEAKEKAEESEAKFRELFSNVNDAIFIFNPDTFEILEANEATSELYGYSYDELIGMSCLKFSAEIEKSKSVGKLIKNEKKVTVKFRHHKKKDGSDVFVELSNYNISVNGKNIIYSVCHDITDIKKAELELIKAKEKAEESEEKFKLLNRLTSEMLLLQDMESIYKFIAENLQKHHPNTIVLNVSIDESIQQSRLEVISGIDNSLLAKVIKISGFNPIGKTYKLTNIHNNYFRSGGFIEFEGGLVEFSASEFPAVAASAIEKLIGLHKIYTIGINKDDGLLAAIHFFTFNKQIITDDNFIEVFAKQAGLVLQKKADEKALIKAKEKAEESEKKLADSLIDLQLAQTIASIGNWQFDPEIGIPIWSDEIYSIYERNKELGPPHIDEYKKMYSEEQYNIFYRAFNAALSEGMDYDIVLKFNSPDNREKWIRAICQPDTTKKSNKGYFLRGTIQDITELKKTELELVKAKEQAEESDRLKSAFLANMSHEIRTPMNGILGFTNLLKEPGLTGEDQQKFISVIEKSGERMLNTVNDIIDISKIEAGQIDVTISDINLNKQLDELFEFFLPEAKKKNIQLSITSRVPDQLTNFKSDKEKLNSILTNFIKNAIKYTHAGSIEFGCSINEKTKQKELKFYVKDTGIGISKDRQQAVFGRFIQADIEDKQAYEGSGLGLAITKAYVEMLGGKTWVESEEGVGSQFYFTIPYETTNKEIHKNNTQDSNKPLSVKKGLKVLIVDDDEFAVTFLQIVLKEYAKEMLIAKTGIEAVEMCRDNPELDIVLMDIKIPGIDGYEATRQIREFNKDVFIVAQTAYAQSGDREKSIQAGCNEYISKPIDKEKLLGIISNRF